MRILILGAGGIGGYFGGRLASAGVDVQFLVRPSRAEVLARDGLVIKSALGDLHVPVKTLMSVTGPFDAVLLACKAYDLKDAMEAVAPAIGPSSLILPLLNGVRQLDMLDARFGRNQVLGGLCHIGVTVNALGEILHLNTLQRFVLGARTPDQMDATERLFEAVRRGGFEPVLGSAIEQEMWEKFTFLATYAGMTTLMRAPIGAIVATDEGEAIMREMLAECIATTEASGYTPRSEAMAQMTASLTERGSAGTASMFRDMARNGRTEHEHVIGDMLVRARASGVPAPLLRTSLTNMQAYEAQRVGAATLMMSSRPTAWLNGLLGVVIFSGSLPATRLALQGFEPLFLTYGRATIAAMAGALALSLFEQKPPRKDEVAGLAIVALGVVIGFPLLTALALQHMTAARGPLYVALLPVMTALFAVFRAGERPRPPFWFFSATASLLVMGFAFTTGRVSGTLPGDLMMLAAVVLCGLGYAEGGRLSRRLGGWQVISWSLLMTLPLMLPLTLVEWPKNLMMVEPPSVFALLYVGLFSMLIGFIFWYRGLAQGGIASIGQLQFLQPFLGLALAAAILGESIGWSLLVVMVLVIGCVAAARRFA